LLVVVGVGIFGALVLLEDLVGDFALDCGGRHGGFGIGVVDFVAGAGEEAAGVEVWGEGEDVVGGDGEEGVVESGGGGHCCGCGNVGVEVGGVLEVGSGMKCETRGVVEQALDMTSGS